MWPKRNNINNKKYRSRSKGKLRYGGKKYSNPFFFKKKKKKNISIITYRGLLIKTKFIFLSILLILIFGFWLFLYSNFFVITKIQVHGQGRIEPKTIEKMAWRQIKDNFFIILPQKNIYLFNEDKLIKNLEMKYSFDSLTIKKKLPNTLIIKYKEKKYRLIWHEDNKYYYADENGHIIAEANLLEIKQKDYPLVDNETESKILDNKVFINQNCINYILNLFQKFKEYDDNFKVERYIIDKDINTVKIVLEIGPRIYFNINEDMDKQINKLIIIKKEKIKEDFDNKTYIDLRYGDRVYYR